MIPANGLTLADLVAMVVMAALIIAAVWAFTRGR